MKLTAVILLAACLQVSAKGNAQQISISEKNVSLQKVFKQIQKQSGYNFLYSYEVLQQAGKVNIQINNASLEEALKECLRDKPLEYSIVEKTVVIKPIHLPETGPDKKLTLPPPVNVRGRIVNEAGEPVEGVSVQVKGTGIGTKTNTNGEFSLNGIDERATLVFTSVNMESREIHLNGQSNLGIIILQTKVAALEVVVIYTG